MTSPISESPPRGLHLPRFLRNRRALVAVLIGVVSVLMAFNSLVLRYSDGGITNAPSWGRGVLLAAEPWVPWLLLAVPLAWLFTGVTVLRGFSWRFVIVHLVTATAVAATLVWGWDRLTDPLLRTVRQEAMMDMLHATLPDTFFEVWAQTPTDGTLTFELPDGAGVEGLAVQGMAVQAVEMGERGLPRIDLGGAEVGDVTVFATTDDAPLEGVHYFSTSDLGFLPALSTQFLTYLVLLALSQGLLFYGEMNRRREETALIRARYDRMRLDSLRSHIDPHFLYNALTAISSAIREDGETARAMIGDLSLLMRESSAREGSLRITLTDELKLAEAYVALIRRRFPRRFEVVFDIEDAARRYEVPAWTLQPLLENVVVHGVQGTKETVTATVRARVESDVLCLEVRDDAPHHPEPSEHLGGTALANLRERLDALFGSGATLEATPLAARGFLAVTRIPRRAAEEEA